MAYAGKVGAETSFRPPNSMPAKGSRPVGVAAAGLAVGLLAGAGIALLLAPLEGSDARRVIGRGMRRARRRGRDAWLDLRDELRHAKLQLLRARRRGRLEVEEAVLDAAD